MMAERKFDREILLMMNLPQSALEDKIIENSRWSIYHEIIFEYEGKFYQTYYSVGATECQYESPWEYDDEIICTEVKKKSVVVEQWVPIED